MDSSQERIWKICMFLCPLVTAKFWSKVRALTCKLEVTRYVIAASHDTPAVGCAIHNRFKWEMLFHRVTRISEELLLLALEKSIV
jgi:hypothetical protein